MCPADLNLKVCKTTLESSKRGADSLESDFQATIDMPMAQKSSHAYSFAKHELPSGPSRESCSLRDGFEFRGQEKPMLCGAAETISAWRVEIEERAEALGSFAADCLLARTGFELGPIKSEVFGK